MTFADFERAVRRLGRKNGVAVRVEKARGKGSHRTLHFGDRKTVILSRHKEARPGLLVKNCKDLGIDPQDL